MKNYFPFSKNLALNGLIFLQSLLFIFHLLVILKVIPGNIIWGGRIKSPDQLFFMEIVGLGILAIFLFLTFMYRNSAKGGTVRKFSRISMWVMFAFYLLSALGNFTSSNLIEIALFGPIALVLAILAARLMVKS